MIPPAIIDEVRQAADIVDVVSDYVALQPSGRNYKALSPFTQEKTPSFIVSPDKQIYKCFSTGKAGNVFSFIMEMEKVPFMEALKLVAQRAGIDISRYTEPKGKQEGEEEQGSGAALRWAARMFHSLLKQPAGAEGWRYFVEERGLREETINRFGLGYAPESWDFLLREARREGIKSEQLVELGLLVSHREKQSLYDSFRHRVIFPIFSRGGQVVGFGGRALVSDERSPKYLNSPESAMFAKSKLLYGLHFAKNEIRRQERAILVEGYMDVLALHQAGLTNAVASCGTALTRYQAKMLRHYSEHVLFVYDADKAGQKSMMSGIDILVSEQMVPQVLMLPEGDDPDSFVRREGRQGFLQYAESHTMGFQDFQLAFFEAAGAFSTPEQKAEALRVMVRTIALIPKRAQRELYAQELSKKVGLTVTALRELLGNATSAVAKQQSCTPSKASATAPTSSSATNATSAPTIPHAPNLPNAQALPPLSVLEKTFLKALLESTQYGTAVLGFAASHQSMLELRHPLAQEIFAHLIHRYHNIAADPEATIDMVSEISAFTNPETRDLASTLLLDPPISPKWQQQNDLFSEQARRCLAMFLDAFKNLVLEPLLDEKNKLMEQIRVEENVEREIELSRQKIVLDKKIREENRSLQQMIKAILDSTQQVG